ncbi:MAG TPA: TrpB-like pyridoxal phosphate-dependent enzyme [Anaerolineae bacterium]|nr:TrpB-like pyridoxal phosphate-dependent enzyme [Anaerolineae bacterium]
MSNQVKYQLEESEMPTAWYNVQADFATPLPPVIHPGTGQPIGPEALAPLFPMDIIMQEASVGPYAERFIDIPEEVYEIYRLWRPTPLLRARRLEKALDTPAHIYYKYEGVSPVGSHKPNTAVPQAYYNKLAGTKRLATETGAGQWGSAVAFASAFFGLEAKVYMVNISYQQKPYRRMLMESYGASIVASPSKDTAAGRKFLEQDPNHTGSLGIAISEALEDTVTTPDTKYSIGSVFNHVLMHQTVIGEEALKQMEKAGEFPDVVIGCVGGGSNFGGIALPFVRGKLKEDKTTRIVAVEPTAAPSLTKGIYTYDFGDTAQMTPLVKMYTLGSAFIPAPIHAGGLRYHAMAPIICKLYNEGVIEAVAVKQNPVFAAAVQFARTEGIIPAPESSHAIRVAIDEALKAKESGEKKVILFNLSGHGHFDMAGYQMYFAGKLEDYEYPVEEVEKAVAGLPKVAA